MEIDPDSDVDHYKVCLAIVHQGMDEMKRSNLERAGSLLSVALQVSQQLPPEQADGLIPLTLCCLSRLQLKKRNPDESSALRERAMPLVDAISLPGHTIAFHDLMSKQLVALKEDRRAIRFCEQAIQLVIDSSNPLDIVLLLLREGDCYNRCGLMEHAAAPLRAALKILRNYPENSLLSGALISLGNALRRSSPEEAERHYLEAAGFHVARAHLESATPAWMNLGILCSEQGRYEESLAYYHKARRVLEQSPHAPRASMGRLLNNMANAHRRKKDFPEALQLVDRAIKILDREDPRTMASACGTRGQILHDAGRDKEAVEWLRKSYALRKSNPSPDLSAIIENLEYEIDSLEKMGSSELAAAKEKLAKARTSKAETQGSGLDWGALTAQAKGAVLVELAFGSRPAGPYGIRDAETAAEQISAILQSRNSGFYGGRTVIPESTTLMFYGNDGELLFQAMEQFLLDHLIFAGAVVTIRQSTNLRQIVIPQSLN